MSQKSRPRKPPRWREEAEDALYNYPASDDYIADMKAEIAALLPTGTSSVIKFDHNSGKTGTHSSTEEYAIRRVAGEENKKLEQAIDRKRRIGLALRRMTKDERAVVIYRYFKRQTVQKITTELLHISRGKFYNDIERALSLVALHLGQCDKGKKNEQNKNKK